MLYSFATGPIIMAEREDESVAQVEAWSNGTFYGTMLGTGSAALGTGIRHLLNARAYFASERRVGWPQKFTSTEVHTANKRISDLHNLTMQLLGRGHIEFLGELVDKVQIQSDVRTLAHHEVENSAKKSKILIGLGVLLMTPFVYQAARYFGPEVVDWVMDKFEEQKPTAIHESPRRGTS